MASDAKIKKELNYEYDVVLVDIGKSAPHKMYAKLDQAVYVYNTATSSWQSLGNHGGTTYGYWNNVLGVDPRSVLLTV